MFLVLSKILGPLADLTNVLALLIVASLIALWARHTRLAACLQSGSVAILLTFGTLPGASWLALPLEMRFQPDPSLPEHVAGIIALGGTERVTASTGWNQPLINDPTPIAMLMALGQRYPDAKLVFSGGGSRTDAKLTEAEIVQSFLNLFGISPNRVIYEDRSRNTQENASLTHELVNPAPADQWILVTQAISMPRAIGVFRKAGWNVIPFPAGYLSSGPNPGFVSANLLGGLDLASVAIHEWIGLMAYRAMGYTNELFPGESLGL